MQWEWHTIGTAALFSGVTHTPKKLVISISYAFSSNSHRKRSCEKDNDPECCSFQVYSANYNGGDIKEVLTAAVKDVQNLAVDWLNFKLYVLEAMVERIDVCDFNGENRITLVAENLQSPHGLALDPTVGCV